jgi:hypothetical protein
VINLKLALVDELGVDQSNVRPLSVELLHRHPINTYIEKQDPKELIKNSIILQYLVAISLSNKREDEKPDVCAYCFPPCSLVSLLVNIDVFYSLPSIFDKIFILFADNEKLYVRGLDLQDINSHAKKAFYDLLSDGFIDPFIRENFYLSKRIEIDISKGMKIYKLENEYEDKDWIHTFSNPIYRYLLSYCSSEGVVNIKFEGHSFEEVLSMKWLSNLYNIFDKVILVFTGDNLPVSHSLIISGLSKLNKNLNASKYNQLCATGHIGSTKLL